MIDIWRGGGAIIYTDTLYQGGKIKKDQMPLNLVSAVFCGA